MPRLLAALPRLLVVLALAGVCGGCDGNEPHPERYEVPVDPDRLVNTVGMRFRRIPAGTFAMGSADGQPDEQPVHTVTITRDFFIGVHEVTQRQWEAVMGDNPSAFTGHDRPVERVSWRDVQRFIEALNEREGAPRYRLPTEAEWEYAARSGSAGAFYFGEDAARLGDHAWFAPNAAGRTHPVGRKRVNAFGLADVHGNVWEWVQDGYEAGYYGRSPSEDPQGPPAGLLRVIRGGGWGDVEEDLRLANRGMARPDFRSAFLGFRLVRTVDEDRG